MTLATPIGRPYVFLSYASADRERTLRIADLLESNGISVWIDRESIAGGSSWSAEIVRGIEECTALVALCSAAAMASPNVQQELQLAWEHRRAVLPLRLDHSPLPRAVEYVLAGRQWIEVLDHADDRWLPVALRALANLGLTSRASGTPSTPTPPEQSVAERSAEKGVSPVPSESSSAASQIETVPPPRHNLPVPVTSFVGRERELAEVEGLLSDTHLLTLTGTGGCGKTRLALQAAAGLVDRFPDGVWFVDLAPLSDPSLVVQAAALALGVREFPGHPIRTTLVESLRSRFLLLLLDNCEHLIEASAQLADDVLQTCGQVRILATSRETLGVRGETTWRVPSLAQPEFGSGTSLEELRQNEAVRLFVDRAQAVVPSFEVTRDNATSLAKVCQRLDGIPLAIELAAARVRVLTLDQIAARLDDRFRLLTGGSRTALRRQQTLRALIDWSHDLLSEAERTLFRRLAVFVGGWTLEAAEVVGSGTGIEGYEVLDLLTGLVDKSLVVFEGQGEDKRYRFLETVRAYAGEKLFEAGEARLIRDQHRDWCLVLAERAEPELFGPATPVWLGRLEADYANIRAALEWCLETDHEAGQRLAGSLWRYWFQRDWMEGGRWLDAMLAQAPEDSVTRGKALLGAGFLYRDMGTLGQARSYTEASLAIARASGDRPLAGLALHNLGNIEEMARDYASARVSLEESIAMCREAGDTLGVGMSLRDLGHLARIAGDYERAAALYGESLALLRVVGHRTNVAWTLRGIGYLARQLMDPDRARVAFRECLTLAREDGTNLLTTMPVLRSLGELERSLGNYDAAEAYFKEDLLNLKKQGLTEFAGFWLYSFGTLLVQRGSYGRGVRFAAVVARELLDPVNILPADVADHAAAVDTARAALGEEAFAAAWAEGHAMTLEQAVAHALEEESAP